MVKYVVSIVARQSLLWGKNHGIEFLRKSFHVNAIGRITKKGTVGQIARVLAAYPLVVNSSFAQTAGSGCAVRITQPVPGQQVSSPEDVTGTAVQIPGGSKLWLLAYRKGFALWWPQGGGAADTSATTWKTLSCFGEPRDVGADFEVTARVFADKQNSDLEAWVKRASETGQYPGITMPPYLVSCGAPIVTVKKAS